MRGLRHRFGVAAAVAAIAAALLASPLVAPSSLSSWAAPEAPAATSAPAAPAAQAAQAAQAAPAALGAPPAQAAPAAPAAPAAKAPTTPTVDELVSRYVAARGGLEKLKAVQTLRQKGRATGPAGRYALLSRELKRPGKIRFEFTFQGVTAVYLSDGQRGWQVSPFEGDMGLLPMPDDVQTDAAEQADIEGPLVDWKSKGHQLELVGREFVDGSDAYKLKLTLKSGALRYFYLDAKSMHHVRTDSTRQMRGRPVQIQTTFSDFKKTAGVLFPRRVEVAAAGRPERLRVQVERVEVNPPIEDARFVLTP